MSEKKKSRVSKVSRVFNQARESLKLLETLEKETLARARTFVRNPIKVNRKKSGNSQPVVSLKTLGLATRSDLEKLERRIETLQSDLTALNEALIKSGSLKRTNKPAGRPAPSAEAFPNT